LYPPTNKIPIAKLELLQAAELTSTPPMAISALEHFKPLECKEIKVKAEKYTQKPRDNNEILTSPLADGSLSEKKHFTLILNEDILDNSPAIRISNCSHFTIRSSIPSITISHHNKFFIEFINCEHFSIEDLNCSSGRNMIFITDSSTFTVRNCKHSDAEGSGIIVNNGNNFRITECLFKNNLAACILIIGNSYNGDIRDCSCSRSRGYFNHDAGIHLCSTSPHIAPSHIPEQYHEPLPIDNKTQRPNHILIKNCMITHCRAQGIYLEGTVNCLIEDNIILNNNKEGICFDWGSSYNIFRRNIVSLNGERNNLSPQEIQVDFISDYPLLENGSSSMKLPGISLDNGCMNLIQENKITSNYGGGVKMIRTALFNSITGNQILGNAIGANQYIPHFHGITVLGLGAVNNEFNSKRQHLLDFMPSILNSITHNTITDHWQPIFFDKISTNNYTSFNKTEPHCCHPGRTRSIIARLNAMLRRYLHRLSKP
jgi:parallel beta-helix repeat protein